jgi:hypothetical protein
LGGVAFIGLLFHGCFCTLAVASGLSTFTFPEVFSCYGNVARVPRYVAAVFARSHASSGAMLNEWVA